MAGTDQRQPESTRGERPASEAPSVRPGQVWNDNRVRGDGGPLRVICVDSAFAHCRGGHAGDGVPRRIPLARFDGRPRGGFALVSDADGVADLVQRRVLTALWQLDYAGLPRRADRVGDMLGGLYGPEEVHQALAAAEMDGLVARSGGGEWVLTGGGRRLAAVG